MSEVKTEKTRWVVHYTHPDCEDDLDLVNADREKIFSYEYEAKEFMALHNFKGRPDYWQPSMYKERLYLVTGESWRYEI